MLLEDLSDDGHSGVDGVGDDEDVGLGCDTADGGGEVTDDRGIGLKVGKKGFV